MIKKCRECGKELPDDSAFCQFCGSSNIEIIEENNNKLCFDCGQTVPHDSAFCPYCGSKNIINSIDEIKEIRVCNTCGKELPDDSVFCQYCGSQDIKLKKIIETRKNDMIFKCPFCGYELVRDASVCPNCKKRLVDGSYLGRTSYKTTYETINRQEKDIRNHKKNKHVNIIVYSVISFALLAFVFFAINSFNVNANFSFFKSINFKNGEKVVELTAYPIYKTRNTSTYKHGFTIKAPKNESVFVVIHLKNDEKGYVGFLVKNNKEYSIALRSGDYEVYYALGTEWYGLDRKFGINTKYCVDTATFKTSDLKEGYSWTTTFDPLDKSIISIKRQCKLICVSKL